MAGSRTHPTLPVACLPALAPALRPLIEPHLRYARIGAGWPDAIGKILSSGQVVDYLLPDGSLDRRRVDPLLRRTLHYIPEIDEVISWGFTAERGWMESHATYGPDWYVRRARRAYRDRNYKLLAFIMGLVTHQGEYLTAFKSLPLMFHGLPRHLAQVSGWVERGGPFYDPHPYRSAERFPLKNIPEALNARLVAHRLRRVGWAGWPRTSTALFSTTTTSTSSRRRWPGCWSTLGATPPAPFSAGGRSPTGAAPTPVSWLQRW